MCAYNGLPYIKEAVACVLNQTYTNWELLIGDDGSADGTRAWLQEQLADNPKVKLYIHSKNLGYVGNKNFLHREATGEYITQLDNDDTCPADRLEKQVQAMLAHPGLKMVAGGYTRIDDQGKEYGTVALAAAEMILQKPEEGYPFWFPSLLVHRSVFDEVGYFDTYFAGLLGDDLYWTVKANARYPIYCLKDLVYGYRNNPNSITNDYNNVRKLIMPAVLQRLFEQRKERGTDVLEQNDLPAMQQLEAGLMANKQFMAEQYRIWAAKAVDKNDLALASHLLKKAVKLNPFNLTIANTYVYWLKRKLQSG